MPDFVLQDFSKEILQKLYSESMNIMEDLGKKAAGEAKSNVKHVSGSLEKAIKYNIEETPKEIILRVGAQISRRNKPWYAHIVEFGSVNSKPSPFLEPATRHLKEDMISRLRSALGKIQ